MVESKEYNPELCEEKHNNINQEFDNVWKAIKDNKNWVSKMNNKFTYILIGIIFNLIGVAGILTTVAIGG